MHLILIISHYINFTYKYNFLYMYFRPKFIFFFYNKKPVKDADPDLIDWQERSICHITASNSLLAWKAEITELIYT